jgi:hypothetical protein
MGEEKIFTHALPQNPFQNLLTNNLTKANSIIASEVRSFLSQLFQSLRNFSSHAKDLSTTQRFGITANL